MRHERTGLNGLFEFPDPNEAPLALPGTRPAAAGVRQFENGRWGWATAEASGADPLALLFRTRDDAIVDRALRQAAPIDDTGRRVLPREHLRKLVSVIAQVCAACNDVYFGGVYWHPRDAGGCNWSVSIMNGHGDHVACLAAVESACDELRRHYAIVDEW